MNERRKPTKRGASKKPVRKAPAQRAKGQRAKGQRDASEGAFTEAFVRLLRSRKIAVPKDLSTAPSEAYAHQPASFVDQLATASDKELKRFAAQVAGYAQRQADRARTEWERSPLIAELRRRKLKEPPPPKRSAGVSVSLAKPLADWSDKELVKAAEHWSKLGS